MSGGYAHSYVLLFEECQTRIQTLGELLLIPCKPHPVFSHKEDLAVTNDNFVRYRDQVISHLNKMLILSRDVSSHIHADIFQWKTFQQPVSDLTTTVVQLTQLSAHIAYLLSLNTSKSKPAVIGPVASRHRLVQADLELKFVCNRLKHSQASDLNPHMLVDMCSTVTKCLSSMTEICREAAEKITDTSEQDQFKLCIKAITSTTGCLVSSVKSFKHASNDSHLQRVISFCQPVVSTSTALLAFATEEQFLGNPAELSHESNEMYKSVVGLAMSMVSACVQITKAARDLVHDPTRTKHKDRVSLCVESISRAASRLRDLLLSYEFISVGDVTSSTYQKDKEEMSNSSGKILFNEDSERNLLKGANVTPRNDISSSSEMGVDNLLTSPSTSPSITSEGSSPKSEPRRHSSYKSEDTSSHSHEEIVSDVCISQRAPQQAVRPSLSSSSSSSSSPTSTSAANHPVSNSPDDNAVLENRSSGHYENSVSLRL